MNKPIAKVIGQNGNVFNIVGICSKALERNGQREEAKKMQGEVFKSASYEEALYIMSQYVEMK